MPTYDPARSDAAPTLIAAMRDEMRHRGYSPKTRNVYLSHIHRFLEETGGRPPMATDEPPVQAAARAWLLEMLRRQAVRHSCLNEATSALRFLFVHVLDVEPPDVRLLRTEVGAGSLAMRRDGYSPGS